MGIIYAEQVDYLEVESMQETHEREIAILNEVDKLAVTYELKKEGLEALQSKLEEYIEHVTEHFASEERLMLEHNYPEYEMHKMAHDMFLADLEYSAGPWRRSGDMKKIIYFIRKTPEWLVMHVNSVDTPAANFLARKMSV